MIKYNEFKVKDPAESNSKEEQKQDDEDDKLLEQGT
jgi:hypothetical protein